MANEPVERHLWICPSCGRKFHIPATATVPKACPDCDGKPVRQLEESEAPPELPDSALTEVKPSPIYRFGERDPVSPATTEPPGSIWRRLRTLAKLHPMQVAALGFIATLCFVLLAAILIILETSTEESPSRRVIAAVTKTAKSKTPTAAKTSIAPTNPSPKKKAARKLLSAEELYKQCSPSVVSLAVVTRNGKRAGGSGFIISDKWVAKRYAHYDSRRQSDSVRGTWTHYVLTNFHVIRSALRITVTLKGGARGPAVHIVTEDAPADIALLCVVLSGVKSRAPLILADQSPSVGAAVFAIGNPLGLERSFSNGIVSGNRTRGGRSWLQTTAAMGPGSSGGPLMTNDGRVVGITTSGFNTGQNLNLCVPVSSIRRMLESGYKTRKIGL